MNRIVLAATALVMAAVPASAQFRGDYYGDSYYEERGYGGWHERRAPYGRHGYNPYDDDDDDDRPRRYRRPPPPPPGYARPPAYTPPPAYGRGGGQQMCVTPHGSCRQGVPVPVGTPCGCVSGGFTSRGYIR